MRFWHFGNQEEFPGDRLGKVRFLLDHLNGLSENLFTPGKNLSLDESMMLWRGRLIFRQYIKGKRHKYGIKCFELCSHDGYVLKVKIYSGKDDDDSATDMGKTASVVIDCIVTTLIKVIIFLRTIIITLLYLLNTCLVDQPISLVH